MYERFATLLKEHKTNPAQVAKATGLNKSTLTHWKQGKYTPKSDKLILIAEYFDVSLEWLQGFTDERKPPTNNPSLEEINLTYQLSIEESFNREWIDLVPIFQKALQILSSSAPPERVLANGIPIVEKNAKEETRTLLTFSLKMVERIASHQSNQTPVLPERP